VTTIASDLEVLEDLNRAYLDAVQGSDVARFRELLADDFLCSRPDGSLVDRDTFLEQTAKPATVSGLRADDVVIRIFGDVAIVHGRTTYTLADGSPGAGRYTDVWERRDGRWLAVAAHVTRN
jgi:ketosteroid isomerase-like protein